MYSLRLRLAHWILDHRKAALAAFALISGFFACPLPRVQLRTIFSDLLPQDDPFVQVFKAHPSFGSPLTVMIMIQRKDGPPDAAGPGYDKTIYNAETLAKVWKLTRDIDLAPGVDHEQILSIATEKARYSEATPNGIDMRPLMGGAPPRQRRGDGHLPRPRQQVRRCARLPDFGRFQRDCSDGHLHRAAHRLRHRRSATCRIWWSRRATRITTYLHDRPAGADRLGLQVRVADGRHLRRHHPGTAGGIGA